MKGNWKDSGTRGTPRDFAARARDSSTTSLFRGRLKNTLPGSEMSLLFCCDTPKATMLPTALHTKYTTVNAQPKWQCKPRQERTQESATTQRQKENYDTDASGAWTHPSGRALFPMTTRATDSKDEAERVRRRSSLVSSSSKQVLALARSSCA